MAINKSMRFGHGFPTEVVQRVTSFLGVSELGALARVNKALSTQSMPPRLYVRNVVKQTQAEVEQLNLPDDAIKRLSVVGEAYRLYLLAEDLRAHAGEMALTGWNMNANARAILTKALRLSGLAALKEITNKLGLLLDGMVKGGELCSSMLEHVDANELRFARPMEAVDAYAGLLRALGRYLAKHDGIVRARISTFSDGVFAKTMHFIEDLGHRESIPHQADKSGRRNLDVLFGELVRAYGRACDWNEKQMSKLENDLVSRRLWLYKDEWTTIRAQAKKDRHNPTSYLELSQANPAKAGEPSQPKRKSMQLTPNFDREKINDMSGPQALEFFAKNFETLLERPDCHEILGRVMLRSVYHWKDGDAAILDMHAQLLRSIAPVVFAARHDQRKKALVAFMPHLRHWMESFLHQCHKVANRLGGKVEMLNLAGELLRIVVLSSPAKQRTAQELNKRYQDDFVGYQLIDAETWKTIVQTALSRPDEALSYLDLKRARQAQDAGQDRDQEDEHTEGGHTKSRENCTVS